MKKFIPILFSAPMVQAILEGRKTMTRRIVKVPANAYGFYVAKNKDGQVTGVYAHDEDERTVKPGTEQEWQIRCPYGQPGDVLWVKETFTVLDYWEDSKSLQIMYNDVSTRVCALTDEEWAKFEKWQSKEGTHSSLFMFKSLSRLWLERTETMVERLQEISSSDSLREGVEKDEGNYYKDYTGFYNPNPFADPYYSFQSLWKKINGTDSWEANPWVWVVSFKVLSTTGKPEAV